jgi:hypothetical protein
MVLSRPKHWTRIRLSRLPIDGTNSETNKINAASKQRPGDEAPEPRARGLVTCSEDDFGAGGSSSARFGFPLTGLRWLERDNKRFFFGVRAFTSRLKSCSGGSRISWRVRSAKIRCQHGPACSDIILIGLANARELGHQETIKPATHGFTLKDLQRLISRKGNPIRTVRNQCVVDICDLQKARLQRNLRSAETVGIPAAVHPFMMVPDDWQNMAQRFQRGADLFPCDGMLFHNFHLVCIEGPQL